MSEVRSSQKVLASRVSQKSLKENRARKSNLAREGTGGSEGAFAIARDCCMTDARLCKGTQQGGRGIWETVKRRREKKRKNGDQVRRDGEWDIDRSTRVYT